MVAPPKPKDTIEFNVTDWVCTCGEKTKRIFWYKGRYVCLNCKEGKTISSVA